MTGTGITGVTEPVRRDGAARGDPDADAAAPERAAAAAGSQAAQPFGIIGWLRWCWRQLTSMRTALVLLFLLAVASVPGSVLPQNGTDPARVAQYISQHRLLGPVLNRLSAFDVFAAPWYAAIYLLLFTSLAGCVLPRAFRLAVSARAKPPAAPRHPSRLPFGCRYQTALPAPQALAAARGLLTAKRFRLQEGGSWLAAEKGYLREAGNLLFHIALLALLAAVAAGALFGYKADELLTEGDGFANTVGAYDQYHPGRAVSPGDLQPFTVWLDRFSASYVQSGPLRGDPSSFSAAIRYQAEPGGATRHYNLQVNRPLNVDGAKVYLIGHGYAPVFRVVDGRGQVALQQAVPFLPANASGFTSEGVIKVPDARPQQLGFAGVFLPTAVDVGGQLESAFPAPLRPVVSLVPYAGNLGLDSGTPQSVYQLDTAAMRRLPIAPRPLFAGQSMKLPDGTGSITFTGYRQWMSVQVTYDPGRFPALLSAIAAIAGLVVSFLVRRRRLFVRVRPAGGSLTEVEFGGLARSDVAGGFEEEFAAMTAALRSAHQVPDGAEPGAGGAEAGGGVEPGQAGPAGPAAQPTARRDSSTAHDSSATREDRE